MKLVKCLCFAGVLALLTVGAAPLKAEFDSSIVMRPLMKLGRGIANVAFGPFELPMKWYDVNAEMGGIASLTYGTLRGVAFVVAREVVGVVDIITFPFPLPNCPDTPHGFGAGYGPIMYPGWVIDVDHDWWNFVYNREAMAAPSN